MPPIQSNNLLWAGYLAKRAIQPSNEPKPNNAFVSMGEWNSGAWNDLTRNMQWYELAYNNLTFRYTVEIFGNQPAGGYPLYIGLHGGGGPANQSDNVPPGPAQYERRFETNNTYWNYMATSYYRSCIAARYDNNGQKDGPPAVYIAARGITDTWDLHFRPESYAAFEILIRRFLLPKPVEAGNTNVNSSTFVNPDMVYLTGFSAGGDGVYRQATKLSDRFAAVDASGGHPGGVALRNLANLPICLQVGEYDTFVNRYTESPRCSLVLDGLAAYTKQTEPSRPYYVHDCFVHLGGDHNNWGATEIDLGKTASVVAKNSISDFYKKNKSDATDTDKALTIASDNVDTNVISWFGNRKRDPIPPYVLWDLSSRPEAPSPTPSDWTPKRFFYWLMISDTYTGSGVIEASYDKMSNSVWIKQALTPFTILLNSDMLNLQKEVIILTGLNKQRVARVQVTQDLTIQIATLEARGDPRMIFSAAIDFDPSTSQAKDAIQSIKFRPSKL